MKKLLTLMLILTIVFCNVVTASAEESLPLGAMDGLRFMLENNEGDAEPAAAPQNGPLRAPAATPAASLTVANLEAGVTVNAYRLVDMNSAGTGKFSYAMNTDYRAVFEALSVSTVREFAAKTDAEVIKAAQANISETKAADKAGVVAEGETTLTLRDLPYGMYFVAIKSDNAGAIYNPMLILLPQTTTEGGLSYDVTATAKSSAPSLEKKVVETAGLVDTASATIGDVVEYQLKIKLPYYTSEIEEESFTFKVTDEMSKGLTYKELTSITVGTAPIAGITPEVTEGETTTVVYDFPYSSLKDYLKYSENGTEQYLYIKYTAELNENAVVGAPGNSNEAFLTYTSDPSVTQEGKYPTKDTPKDETKVYTFGLDITKYELGDTNVKLAGAEFSLKKGSQDIYFKSLGENRYTAVIDNGGDTTGLTKTVLTGEGGKLIIEGLGEGKFTLKEEKAPEGYYIYENNIEIVITGDKTGGELNGNVATGNGNEATTAGVYYVKSIANSTEYTLPGTGGQGTVIFIGAAALLLICACVLLYRRRRHQE